MSQTPNASVTPVAVKEFDYTTIATLRAISAHAKAQSRTILTQAGGHGGLVYCAASQGGTIQIEVFSAEGRGQILLTLPRECMESDE